MKKQSLIIIFALSGMLLGANFKSDKYQYKTSVIIKNDTIKIEKNKILMLSDASTFTFEFTMPKGECYVNIYASDKKDNYYKFLKGTPTSALEPFKMGSAFSVGTNEYNTIKDELIVSDKGHQPYVFDKPEFTSFRRMKTTDKNYIFYSDINDIVFDDGKGSFKKCPIQKFQSDTIYFIVETYYKKSDWKNIETTAFKMSLR